MDSTHSSLGAPGTPESREDLAADRVVPVAERAPDRGCVGAERPAAQDLVIRAEEHLGVFAIRERREARISVNVGAGPLPDVPDQLVHAEPRRAGRVRADLGRAQVALAEIRMFAAGVVVG